MNTIDIDPNGSAKEVAFESTTERSAPHLGSIVMFKYKTLTCAEVERWRKLNNGHDVPSKMHCATMAHQKSAHETSVH
jgi:outer membrane usher protein FimD/PapC